MTTCCIAWPAKDPDEILDFGLKWADRLNGDTIFDSDWIVPLGITKTGESFTDDITTIWLSGGTINTTYEFVNRVVTAGGRTHEQTTRLRCRTK